MRKFYRQDLQKLYQNDPNFHRKVLKSQRQHSQILQRAQKSNDWQKAINDTIIQTFLTQDNRIIYFFYGFRQPQPGRKKLQLMLYFFMNFRPDPQKQYAFVYFNDKTPSSDYYFEFQSIFSLVPISMLQKLTNFILVKPYLYMKAWDLAYTGFTNIHRIYQQNYQTFDSTVEVLKKLKIKPHQFVQFVPEQLSQEFPSNFKRKPSLSSYRINLTGQKMSQQQLKERRDFQNTIKALFTKQVYKLQNYQLGQVGIPIILQVLVNYFKVKPEGLKLQGIFRKSVSVDEQKQIMQQLSQRNYDYIINNVQNPHIIACLIKKFFSNLKQPIISFKLFNQLMNDQHVSNKKQYVKTIIKKLPELNTTTLVYLIQFLKKDVTIHEKQSKMSAHNLSICFSPALMRSQKPSMADIMYAQKAVTITEMIMNDIDYFFEAQSIRSQIFQKSMLMKKKDFKKTMRQQLNLSIDERPSQQYECFTMPQQSVQKSFIKKQQNPVSFTPNNEIIHKKQQINQKPRQSVKTSFIKMQQNPVSFNQNDELLHKNQQINHKPRQSVKKSFIKMQQNFESFDQNNEEVHKKQQINHNIYKQPIKPQKQNQKHIQTKKSQDYSLLLQPNQNQQNDDVKHNYRNQMIQMLLKKSQKQNEQHKQIPLRLSKKQQQIKRQGVAENLEHKQRDN